MALLLWALFGRDRSGPTGKRLLQAYGSGLRCRTRCPTDQPAFPCSVWHQNIMVSAALSQSIVVMSGRACVTKKKRPQRISLKWHCPYLFVDLPINCLNSVVKKLLKLKPVDRTVGAAPSALLKLQRQSLCSERIVTLIDFVSCNGAISVDAR